MRTLMVYSLNSFHVQHAAVWLCSSLYALRPDVLINPCRRLKYLLPAFVQSPPASGNQESYLCFCEPCFWSTVQLRHKCSLAPPWWFSISSSRFLHISLTWLCSSDGKATLSEDCHLMTSCGWMCFPWVSPAVTWPEWWGPWRVMMKQRTFILSWFLRYSWHNIRFTSGLQHNDLLFVHNVKCYHLSPHREHVFLFPMQIICLCKDQWLRSLPTEFRECSRGKFFVVSLLFSSRK